MSLTRKRQVACKIEGTEGTAESLALADAKTLGFSPKISHDVKMFNNNPARATMGDAGQIPGQRSAKHTFSFTLRGSGVATTAPDWVKIFKAAGCKESAVSSINIGSITSGPFQHAEIVTGGTSGATGRVILNTATGAALIYVVVLSGSFQSAETLTGGTSGATCTTSSVATSCGTALEPSTNGISSLTMANMEDGIAKTIKGARGNVKLDLKVGQPAIVDAEFSGAEAGVTDTALFTNPAYEATKPPVFMGATITVDGVALKISDLTVDNGCTVSPTDDITQSAGIFSFIIGNRMSQGTFTARMEAVATHDFFGKWYSGALMVLDFLWGSSSGNKFHFQAPKIQYTKNDDADAGGLASVKSSFAITESMTPGDDGWVLLCL